MSPQRRKEDGLAFIVRYWAVIVVLLGWFVVGIVGFIHLEDHVIAIQNRLDFHFGKEFILQMSEEE